ncbi:MAG: FAD:protein FMN transferase [Oscillospiraceae bacterium]
MENQPTQPARRRTRARWVRAVCILLALALVAAAVAYNLLQRQAYTSATFAMDAMVSQTAYGPGAQRAMQQVNLALAEYEQEFSLYSETGDVARINEAAGKGGADVSPRTAALIQQATQLSAQSKGAFAISIAPLTLAWGITSGSPRVPSQQEIDSLLPLVNDDAIQVEGTHVALAKEGLALDLGAIAKGAACTEMAAIYAQNGVKSALLSIGGSSIYALGTKPDGTQYRVGFRDPAGGGSAYIASFALQNQSISVSGGYERYFVQNGKTYIHILNPLTGYPVESDIASVGVIHPDGAVAEFYSTTLFIWGVEEALEYMRGGGAAIVLDTAGNLYVSASLEEGFQLHQQAESSYNLTFVEAAN